ncbi:hypothetical protein MMC07_006506 [Pseudocyphellaria aurata]|nr:hypothetical protein [Pseudocyphellaria aurata]
MNGAFSIVISGQDEHLDADRGETLYYSSSQALQNEDQDNPIISMHTEYQASPQPSSAANEGPDNPYPIHFAKLIGTHTWPNLQKFTLARVAMLLDGNGYLEFFERHRYTLRGLWLEKVMIMNPEQTCGVSSEADKIHVDAHRISGIAGSKTNGAFSIVVSGQYEHLDADRGETLYYSSPQALQNEDQDNPIISMHTEYQASPVAKRTAPFRSSYPATLQNEVPDNPIISMHTEAILQPRSGLSPDGYHWALAQRPKDARSVDRMAPFVGFKSLKVFKLPIRYLVKSRTLHVASRHAKNSDDRSGGGDYHDEGPRALAPRAKDATSSGGSSSAGAAANTKTAEDVAVMHAFPELLFALQWTMTNFSAEMRAASHSAETRQGILIEFRGYRSASSAVYSAMKLLYSGIFDDVGLVLTFTYNTIDQLQAKAIAIAIALKKPPRILSPVTCEDSFGAVDPSVVPETCLDQEYPHRVSCNYHGEGPLVGSPIYYSPDQEYLHRVSCNSHGEGPLVVGQWWPFQICSLRDGGHGSSNGGIHGRRGDGAYSVLLGSRSTEFQDVDKGDVIEYCGEMDKDGDPSWSAQLLLESFEKTSAVRVFRSSRLPTANVYCLSQGIRYDGLYQLVTAGRLPEMYIFSLERIEGQMPMRCSGRPILGSSSSIFPSNLSTSLEYKLLSPGFSLKGQNCRACIGIRILRKATLSNIAETLVKTAIHPGRLNYFSSPLRKCLRFDSPMFLQKQLKELKSKGKGRAVRTNDDFFDDEDDEADD